jgi:thymidylate synthase
MITPNVYTEERNLWRQIFVDVKKNGKIVAPRDKEIIEVENYHYELPPYTRFCTLTPRDLKFDYIRAETNWMLRGDPYDLSIGTASNIWKNIVVDGKLNSNYGYAWYTKFGFDFVVKQLIADKDSRRASTVIVEREHLDLRQKDVPCTAYVNFRIREDKLNMSVHMRSQDAIYGMGNDAPAFSFLHEMVFVTLRDSQYPELQMGTYHHTSDSFHVYQRHYEMLDALVAEDVGFSPAPFPRIKSIGEVNYLLSKNIGRQSLVVAGPPNDVDFKFTKWLETGLIEIF